MYLLQGASPTYQREQDEETKTLQTQAPLLLDTLLEMILEHRKVRQV